MPEISISEEQHERLEEVRQAVEDAYVENYGYIPIEDVIQYLLDTYTPPGERRPMDDYERLATAEYPKLQAVASEVPEVPGSGIDADEMRGRLLAELGVERFAAKLEAVADAESSGETPGDESGAGPAPGPTAGEDPDSHGVGPTAGEDPDSPGAGKDTPEATDSPDGPDSDQSPGRTAAGGGSSGGTADGDSDETRPGDTSSPGGGVSVDTSGGSDPLAAVNRMLDEHDDKWRESGGDEPYEVDLPDGRTDSVRTKDDVRQLLFRYY